VLEQVARRANTGRDVDDGCMVMGVGAVVRRGDDGAEEGEGEGRWVSVAECQFQEENEHHMTGSNRKKMMMMEKKKTAWILCILRG
jgi:hypothetical protein